MLTRIQHVIFGYFKGAFTLYMLMRNCNLPRVIITLIPSKELSIDKNLWIHPAYKSFNAVSFVREECRSLQQSWDVFCYCLNLYHHCHGARSCQHTRNQLLLQVHTHTSTYTRGFFLFILGLTGDRPEQSSSRSLCSSSKMP